MTLRPHDRVQPMLRRLASLVLAGAALLSEGCAPWQDSAPAARGTATAPGTAAAPGGAAAPATAVAAPDACANPAVRGQTIPCGRRIDTLPATLAVTTAHPLASEAALAMLARGGAPIDAAVAAQMVLGLVEPQSSGIGGGLLMLHWDAAARQLTSIDGLAAAPARATASLRTDTDGQLLDAARSQRGGRTVGVPGALSALRMAHERHGRLPWAVLFEPARQLALEGYPMAPYVHAVLSQPGAARDHADWHDSHFDAQGRPLPVGTRLRHPAYAATLARIAASGPAGLLENPGERDLSQALQRGYRPSLITPAELRSYRAVAREPVCAPFVGYRVCAMAPPSFGGIAVLQILQMVEARAQGRFDFTDPQFVHLYAEAGKLAQADRSRWVGDPDFVAVPTAALVDPAYARRRAALIRTDQATAEPPAGNPTERAAQFAPDLSQPSDTTSQIAIVDAQGNAVSITTTINLNFGARLAAGGFVLNNALTNFSAAPRPGQLLANQMAPGKRPVTSMAPVIVFDPAGQAVLVGGSAGGGQIVDYLASSLIEMLANQRTPAQALAAGHVSTALRPRLQLEQGTLAAGLAPALRAMGHPVDVTPMISGLGFLKRTPAGWLGGADPRRDGVALGQ